MSSSPIIRFKLQSGSGTMGDVSDETRLIGRFAVPRDDMSLLYVRAKFVGGTLVADLNLHLDRQAFSEVLKKDTLLFTWEGVGAALQVHARFSESARKAWSFVKGDHLVFVWPNPEVGTISWDLEVALIDTFS